MSVIRVHRPRQFSIMPTQTLRDDRLSLGALGLLGRLLSRPDGWEIRMGPLQAECRIGRDRLRALLRELTEAGYVIRRRTHDPITGQWDWASEVYDTPQQSTIDGFPVDGDSVDVKSVDGKHVDISITEAVNTDLRNTYTPPTTTGAACGVGGGGVQIQEQELEEYCNAALWAAQRGHKPPHNPGGYLAAIRARLVEQGPSEADRQTLRAWRRRMQQQPLTHERKPPLPPVSSLGEIVEEIHKGEQKRPGRPPVSLL